MSRANELFDLRSAMTCYCFTLAKKEMFSTAGRHLRMWSIMWSRLDNMETIQIVLDKKLLDATDEAAQRTKRNRSALVRDALREHLRRLEVRAKEQRDRRGYARQPQTADESLVWEAEATWPAE